MKALYLLTAIAVCLVSLGGCDRTVQMSISEENFTPKATQMDRRYIYAVQQYCQDKEAQYCRVIFESIRDGANGLKSASMGPEMEEKMHHYLNRACELGDYIARIARADASLGKRAKVTGPVMYVGN